MEKSKVYFTNMRTKHGDNLLNKLERLIRVAGISNIDFQDKFAAIKLHFGEPGNLAYLRPNYARVIADVVKSLGGKPFLTDANTLYVGRRKDALEHIESAYENGFSPFSTGCHIIIADGLKGTDETIVDIDGEYIKQAKIGRAVMDADILISLTHFKGHMQTGFGGAFKNIGMGCGSRAGKMEMHNSGKPLVNVDKCVSCGICKKECAHDAIIFDSLNKAVIVDDKCVGCGRCIGVCFKDAIYGKWDEALDVLNKKIAEYTYAIIKDKPHFHISLVVDVSPNCDCHSANDAAIIPNVGMFASFDPVALDVACVDACNSQTPIRETALEEANSKKDLDHFNMLHPNSNWRACVEHGEKLGIGTSQYELIEVK